MIDFWFPAIDLWQIVYEISTSIRLLTQDLLYDPLYVLTIWQLIINSAEQKSNFKVRLISNAPIYIMSTTP